MRFDEKMEDIQKLVKEAQEKRIAYTKELNKLNKLIDDLKKKQNNIMKIRDDAEKNLQGHSVYALHEKLSKIIRAMSKDFSFFDYYGTDDIDIEKLIDEKVFLNNMIIVMGGNRISSYYNYRFENTTSRKKFVARQKTFMRKMTHPILMKSITPYLNDIEKARISYDNQYFK